MTTLYLYFDLCHTSSPLIYIPVSFIFDIAPSPDMVHCHLPIIFLFGRGLNRCMVIMHHHMGGQVFLGYQCMRCRRLLIGWRARNTKLPGTVDKVGPGDIKRITVRVIESVFNVLSRNDALVVLQYGKNEISTCFRCDCV